jgi:hypothetical protein
LQGFLGRHAKKIKSVLSKGSLWGITPQTAKKTITSTLEAVNGGTIVRCSSKLASDWKNITLIGCAFALFLYVYACG